MAWIESVKLRQLEDNKSDIKEIRISPLQYAFSNAISFQHLKKPESLILRVLDYIGMVNYFDGEAFEATELHLQNGEKLLVKGKCDDVDALFMEELSKADPAMVSQALAPKPS